VSQFTSRIPVSGSRTTNGTFCSYPSAKLTHRLRDNTEGRASASRFHRKSSRKWGEITVESEIGRGSTFSFTVALDVAPLEGQAIADPDQAVTDEPPEHIISDRRPVRILLAEDNAVNQLVARRFLERLGHDVDVVPDGAAALVALQTDRYDLVLMDCNMPNVDGFEATRRIRRGEAGRAVRSIPIIALTASATVDDHNSCLAAGQFEELAGDGVSLARRRTSRGLEPDHDAAPQKSQLKSP
jgi:CheY-like chemotaxis protein